MLNETKAILRIKTLEFHRIVKPKVENLSNLLLYPHKQKLNLLKQRKTKVNLINPLLKDEIIKIGEWRLLPPNAHTLKMRINKRKYRKITLDTYQHSRINKNVSRLKFHLFILLLTQTAIKKERKNINWTPLKINKKE